MPSNGGVRGVQALGIMMTFAMVMTEVMTMCAMEMMMNAMAMCKTEMMRRLPTTLVLVVTSRVLCKDKITTSLESLRRCPYKMGQNSIFHNN
jgi:hypothetical protein